MRIKLLATVLVLGSALLSACQTMTSSNRVIVSSAESWALLPIVNLSTTPLAGDRAVALVETQLRARGVKDLEIYRAPESETVIALLDEAGQLEKAKKWASQNGIRYGITGEVQEWSYKNGLDNEPSIAMTLKFIDLHSNDVMWAATGTRTGWGYSNLASTANKTIGELLTQVQFDSNALGRPTLAAANDGSVSYGGSVNGGTESGGSMNNAHSQSVGQSELELDNTTTAPIRPVTIYQQPYQQ